MDYMYISKKRLSTGRNVVGRGVVDEVSLDKMSPEDLPAHIYQQALAKQNVIYVLFFRL